MNKKQTTPLTTMTLALAIVATALSSNAFAGRYDGLVHSIDEFVGGAAAVKRNDGDAFVALGENGNRFRMDYSGHGDKPHFHLEVPGSGNGKHVDAPGTNHRNYFNK